MKEFLRNELDDSEYRIREDIHSNPLKINHPQRGSRFSLDYEPDACLEHHHNRVIVGVVVFEILDKQNEAKTIADIVRCIFLGNCERLIFIAKTQAGQLYVKNVVDTILGSLFKLYSKIPFGKNKAKNIKNVILDVDVILSFHMKTEIKRLLEN